MYIPRVFPNKDTTYTKLFVGGLPYHTTDKSLHEHFQVYGEIEEAVVITNRVTGESKGYGFVTMAEIESAVMACKDPNPIIDGRKANVNLAFRGAKQRVLPTTVPTALTPTVPVPPTQYGYPQYMYHPAYMPVPGVVPTNVKPPSPVTQVTPAPVTQVSPTSSGSPPTTQCVDYAYLQQQYADYLARVTAANQLTAASVTCPHGNLLNSVRYMVPSYPYYLPQTTVQGMGFTGQLHSSPSVTQEVSTNCSGMITQVSQPEMEGHRLNTQEIVLEEMKQ